MMNDQIVAEIRTNTEQKIQNEIENTPSPIEYSKLNSFLIEQQQAAMQEVRLILFEISKHKSNILRAFVTKTFCVCLKFDSRKLGDAEITSSFREKLSRDLTELQATLIKVSETYNRLLNSYAESMQQVLIGTTSFVDQGELIRLQQVKKTEAVAQVSWFLMHLSMLHYFV